MHLRSDAEFVGSRTRGRTATKMQAFILERRVLENCRLLIRVTLFFRRDFYCVYFSIQCLHCFCRLIRICSMFELHWARGQKNLSGKFRGFEFAQKLSLPT